MPKDSKLNHLNSESEGGFHKIEVDWLIGEHKNRKKSTCTWLLKHTRITMHYNNIIKKIIKSV